MAVVKIPAENVTITEADAVKSFLKARGIDYERWTPNADVAADAGPEAILEAYAPQVAALKAQGGYVTADIIDPNVKSS